MKKFCVHIKVRLVLQCAHRFRVVDSRVVVVAFVSGHESITQYMYRLFVVYLTAGIGEPHQHKIETRIPIK